MYATPCLLYQQEQGGRQLWSLSCRLDIRAQDNVFCQVEFLKSFLLHVLPPCTQRTCIGLSFPRHTRPERETNAESILQQTVFLTRSFEVGAQFVLAIIEFCQGFSSIGTPFNITYGTPHSHDQRGQKDKAGRN